MDSLAVFLNTQRFVRRMVSRNDGGKGSGFFNHSGRPNQIGGSSAHAPRTEEELQEAANSLSRLVDGYMNMPSLWKGKIVVDYNLKNQGYAGAKAANCHILLSDTCGDDTIIHEYLHSLSKKAGTVAYAFHDKMEEASTQLITELICERNGIHCHKTYKNEVLILKSICKKLSADPLDVAIEMYKQPLSKRYRWIKKRYIDYCIQEGYNETRIKSIKKRISKLKGSY